MTPMSTMHSLVSVLLRAITILLGYIFPAYECFKSVERNRPDMENLQFWCRYWIILAALTSVERIGDTFISWLPMYAEAKIAFIIYLWYPRTKGTAYVYSTFLKPFVASYELEIDNSLNELKTKASDVVGMYGPQASVYLQSMFGDFIQYLASQSTTGQSTVNAGGSLRASSTSGALNSRPAITEDEDLGFDIIDEEPEPVAGEEPVAAAYMSKNRRRMTYGW